MIKASDIIEILNEKNIIDLMVHLGSNPPKESSKGLIFNTICHNQAGEGKQNLFYNKTDKYFYCHSNCHGIGNVFNIVMKVLEYDFKKAYVYILNFFNFSKSNISNIVSDKDKLNHSFINGYKKRGLEELTYYDDKFLNVYEKYIFHKSWIDDYINPEIMIKFEVMYNVVNNNIVIPHRAINGGLAGVRCRNLEKNLVENGQKYMPIYYNGTVYKYPTSLNLYGIYQNQNNIRDTRSVVIGESEKFVLQHSTYFEKSNSVALSSSHISDNQIKFLQDLNVETVVLCLDKDFTNTIEEHEYKKKINNKIIKKLITYFKIEVVWDIADLLDYKMSPTDKGKEIYEELYNNRIFVS